MRIIQNSSQLLISEVIINNLAPGDADASFFQCWHRQKKGINIQISNDNSSKVFKEIPTTTLKSYWSTNIWFTPALKKIYLSVIVGNIRLISPSARLSQTVFHEICKTPRCDLLKVSSRVLSTFLLLLTSIIGWLFHRFSSNIMSIVKYIISNSNT